MIHPNVKTNFVVERDVVKKACSKCGRTLELSCFRVDTHLVSGLRSQCIDCQQVSDKARKNKNRVEYNAKARIRTKEYYRNHRSERMEYNRKYAIKNKVALDVYHAIYRSKHKEHRRDYYRTKYKKDIQFRIRCQIAGRILNAIKAAGGIKSAPTLALLGCTIKAVRIHLESLFQPGMTWENHGSGDDRWHIDHIRPCSSFDLIDPEQQKQCFHWTNLQPLWAKDNLSKGDKFSLSIRNSELI